MKVVICGAGQVGSAIARYLANEQNDVTVIDQRPDLVRRIGDTLDVRTFVGHASHPDVLEKAGAADAEMLIAVTLADEVNMLACKIGHALFNVPTKIARVRHQSYLAPMWAELYRREHLSIDVIISPEIEVAGAIARTLEAPGVVDTIVMADRRVRVAGVRCLADCPIINTPLRQLTGLFPDLQIRVLAILRGDRVIVPTSADHMAAGDEVYFICDDGHLTRALAAFGHEEPSARRVVIAGGGNIGQFLARKIEQDHPGVSIKLLEIDADRATRVQQSLGRTIVLAGDALDPEVLDEANVAGAEAFIAVSNDDKVNIISSLLAKRQGSGRAITLVNQSSYIPLLGTLGIDAVVSPRGITVSTILHHIRRGRIRAAYSLRDGFGEIIEIEALETSTLVGRPLKDVRLPAGALVGAVVRGDKLILPRADTVIQTKDRVVLFATGDAIPKIEKLLSVRLEFF